MARLELLAPAKDLACGIAAIDCGADAVYIGAPRFGARANAGNPVADIAALCAYAHQYWARVYVTINTLLRDDELHDAVALMWELSAAGVDGFIIQDVGLLECELPPLPLIASTQMHNHTPARVRFLQQIGFSRAILARELTLDEIARLHEAVPQIELEAFIHGALCVCYSGQCYLSHARGGRSGNRGDCAQPCRLRYTLVDREGSVVAGPAHMLSLKDLNHSASLEQMIAAGVTCFKIEGRLKDRAYVMNTVAFYRAKLDALIARGVHQRSSSGASQPGFAPDVRKSFNRGFTSYFLHGRAAKMGAHATPKSLGEPLGPVRCADGTVVEIDTDTLINNGDGICYLDRQGALAGTRVNAVHGRRVTLNERVDIAPGTMVYRNYDQQFVRLLERATPARTVAVRFELAVAAHDVTLRAVDEDGVHAEQRAACALAAADNAGSMRDRAVRQLGKCGGTMFACEHVAVTMPAARVVPVALLNELRRAVLDKLQAARLAQRPREAPCARDASARYPADTLDFRGNVLNAAAAALYRRHGVREIEAAAEAGSCMAGKPVMTTRYCVLHELGMCLRTPRGKALRAPLYLVDDNGWRLELRCNAAACQIELVLAD